MNKMLILGGGPLQVPIVEKAKKLGLFTVVVDVNENSPGKSVADAFFPYSTLDYNALHSLMSDGEFVGVITNSDYPTRIVSALADAYNLNGNSTLTSSLMTNKLLLREVLADAGIEGPRFSKVISLEEAKFYAHAIGYPVIIKPVDSSASRGVFLINDKQGIQEAFFEAMKHSRSKVVIMEEFLKGKEYSVESLTLDGHTEVIAITEKITSGPPNFVETGHIIPAQLDDQTSKSIRLIVQKALKKLNFKNGASHAEVIVAKQGIRIVEIGPRLGGDYITSDLVPLATGYDIVENAIRVASAMSIKLFEPVDAQAGIVFFEAASGRVQEIIGKDELTHNQNVVRFEFFIQIGDHVKAIENSLDRCGYCIIRARDRASLLDIMSRVKSNIKINTI